MLTDAHAGSYARRSMPERPSPGWDHAGAAAPAGRPGTQQGRAPAPARGARQFPLGPGAVHDPQGDRTAGPVTSAGALLRPGHPGSSVPPACRSRTCPCPGSGHLPSGQARAIPGLGRTLTDVDHPDQVPRAGGALTVAAAGPADPPFRAQVFGQLTSRGTAGLHIQGAVDRLVRHLQLRPVGVGALQPAGDLLRGPAAKRASCGTASGVAFTGASTRGGPPPGRR